MSGIQYQPEASCRDPRKAKLHPVRGIVGYTNWHCFYPFSPVYRIWSLSLLLQGLAVNRDKREAPENLCSDNRTPRPVDRVSVLGPQRIFAWHENEAAPLQRRFVFTWRVGVGAWASVPDNRRSAPWWTSSHYVVLLAAASLNSHPA